jgi:hypothetical protein
VPLILLGARPVTRFLPFAIFAYHCPSLRRVFGGSRRQVAWKGTLIWFAYLVVVVTAMIVGMERRGAQRQADSAGRRTPGH